MPRREEAARPNFSPGPHPPCCSGRQPVPWKQQRERKRADSPVFVRRKQPAKRRELPDTAVELPIQPRQSAKPVYVYLDLPLIIH